MKNPPVYISLLNIEKLAQHLTSSSSRFKEVYVKQHAELSNSSGSFFGIRIM